MLFYNHYTFNYWNFFKYCFSFTLSSPLELSSYYTDAHPIQPILLILTFFSYFSFLYLFLVHFG